MLITPESFWLCGRPREILRQIKELQRKHYYVQEVIGLYYPLAKIR
jgi:hypothetical protein